MKGHARSLDYGSSGKEMEAATETGLIWGVCTALKTAFQVWPPVYFSLLEKIPGARQGV